MSISIFETRTMIQMLEQMKPANTFLRDTFFANRKNFETKFVDVDIYKGKRRVAPFVHRKVGSKTVERLGFETKTYEPVQVGVDTITTAQDLLSRAPNETVYGAMSPDARAAEIMARDMRELDDMITRNEEIQCSQALFAGAVTQVGEGVNEVVTYGVTEVTVASGDKWDQSTSDPEQLLRTMCREVRQSSGRNPNIAIFGANAADKFLANAAIQKKFNLWNMTFGQLEPRILPNGVTFLGRMNSVGLDIYTYDEWYIDANGDEQPMVPVDDILVADSSAYRSLFYGVVVDVSIGSYALPRVPKSWVEEKPSARYLQLVSCPLAVPHQVDAHCKATVL